MTTILQSFRKNRTLWITLLALSVIFILGVRGLVDPAAEGGERYKNVVITILRGFSTGSIIFLVASGFSIIFGLMNVLNMAHGALFMIGAYVGWTMAVRPDTVVDAFTPLVLIAAGFTLLPVWDWLLKKVKLPKIVRSIWPWAGLILAVVVLGFAIPKYPITSWNVGSYEISPTNFAFAASQGQLILPEAEQFIEISPAIGLGALILGGILAGITVAGFAINRRPATAGPSGKENSLPIKGLVFFGGLILLGLLVHYFNTPISAFLLAIDSTWLFILAVLVAVTTGALLGALIESTLVRPLYETHIYVLMLSLGVSSIIIEAVRTIWGAPEFTMPRPSIFNGTGDGCPAESIGAIFQNKCSTIFVLGGRVRTYNELFIPILGIIVLIAVWILLQRTRLGMIVRAGVQDSEMVRALGINVERIFTIVFALGVGLAALGGVVGAPSTGLTTTLGDSLLINLLVALAIGGLTSYPGAAAGALIVGLLQQFIIKYGQIGINIPFMDEPFKPTPPLVPAMTVLLMVVILLVLPNGLFGRKE
ncbi:MAG: branched-chain amino acid ABC transporter permease [Chloroflexi bacterium]|jgi:branched-chain amino acid transport system permease protein|nr:branched-chain amino acid ABC transporter permease [Chloroflexota bacterium]